MPGAASGLPVPLCGLAADPIGADDTHGFTARGQDPGFAHAPCRVQSRSPVGDISKVLAVVAACPFCSASMHPSSDIAVVIIVATDIEHLFCVLGYKAIKSNKSLCF